MVEMFELVNHLKRFLTASVELGRFSSKGMATSATGDLAVPSLIQDAGASDSTVAGGDHIHERSRTGQSGELPDERACMVVDEFAVAEMLIVRLHPRRSGEDYLQPW